jgi:hypothetical protein
VEVAPDRNHHETRANGKKQFNVTSDYQGVYPSGQRCAAACRNATVTLSLP